MVDSVHKMFENLMGPNEYVLRVDEVVGSPRTWVAKVIRDSGLREQCGARRKLVDVYFVTLSVSKRARQWNVRETVPVTTHDQSLVVFCNGEAVEVAAQ